MDREIADIILDALRYGRHAVETRPYCLVCSVDSHRKEQERRTETLARIARAEDCIRDLKKAMPKEAKS